MIAGSIKAIWKFEQITNTIGPDTLVLIDIDDTVFSSCSDWGSGEQFGTMSRKEQAQGYTVMQAKKAVYDRWIESQSNIITKLVDPRFNDFLELCERNGSLAIGFAARRPSIASVTDQQLLNHNVKFKNLDGLNFEKNYRKCLNPNDKIASLLDIFDECETLYSNGTLYCHDANSKGQVFPDFFEALKVYCTKNSLTIPTKVLFVDDGLHNHVALAETCKTMNLEYYGYHIQSTYRPYDKKIAHQQETIFSITGQYHRRNRSFDGGEIKSIFQLKAPANNIIADDVIVELQEIAPEKNVALPNKI